MLNKPAPKRYLLCPGTVRSATDGDYHYITATNLAQLYGVPMDRCVVLPDRDTPWEIRDRMRYLEMVAKGEMLKLAPRANGNYTLPTGIHRNGCHNRKSFAPLVQIDAEHSYPFRMSPDCEYTKTTLGRKDDGCLGCSWRQKDYP